MSSKTIALLEDSETRELLRISCENNGFELVEFEGLVKAQIKFAGVANRSRLYATFDDILDRLKKD